MKIINISTAYIKDENLFKEYLTKAGVLIKEQGVEVICKGKYVASTSGLNQGPYIMAIFKYKDRAAFDYFYACEAYQAILPLRDQACEMNIQVYTEI